MLSDFLTRPIICHQVAELQFYWRLCEFSSFHFCTCTFLAPNLLILIQCRAFAWVAAGFFRFLQLIYNVVSVPVVQQSDSVIHIYIHTHIYVCMYVCMYLTHIIHIHIRKRKNIIAWCGLGKFEILPPESPDLLACTLGYLRPVSKGGKRKKKRHLTKTKAWMEHVLEE